MLVQTMACRLPDLADGESSISNPSEVTSMPFDMGKQRSFHHEAATLGADDIYIPTGHDTKNIRAWGSQYDHSGTPFLLYSLMYESYSLPPSLLY